MTNETIYSLFIVVEFRTLHYHLSYLSFFLQFDFDNNNNCWKKKKVCSKLITSGWFFMSTLLNFRLCPIFKYKNVLYLLQRKCLPVYSDLSMDRPMDWFLVPRVLNDVTYIIHKIIPILRCVITLEFPGDWLNKLLFHSQNLVFLLRNLRLINAALHKNISRNLYNTSCCPLERDLLA